jgi:DnaK suppressor protein
MDAKNIRNSRQRLSEEYQNLLQAINRNRLAAKELAVQNTEDEVDLATISQNRELLYDLHESDFLRLRSVQEALKTIDSGQYGECVRCGEDINEKRLMAVPWTTLCIRCQEEKEMEHTSSRLVLAGMDEPEMES